METNTFVADEVKRLEAGKSGWLQRIRRRGSIAVS